MTVLLLLVLLLVVVLLLSVLLKFQSVGGWGMDGWLDGAIVDCDETVR